MKNTSPFTFDLSTRIIFGYNVENQLPKILDEFKLRYPIIVTDKGIREVGLIDNFIAYMKNSNISYEIFDEIEANPKDYNVDNGVAKILESKCDCLVAIGGGSPIDCAKAMAAVATIGGNAREYVDKEAIDGTVMPLIAVPTTAGTGSEVTYGAVITDTEQKLKFTIKGTALAPKVALLDPKLTVSMPPPLTAATGMDALTHAIEAYTVRNAEPLSNAMALHSIELISRYLRVAYNKGTDLDARTGMLLGSLMAGLAFSHSDVGAVHCIAEALGGMYDIPHGVCNAVMLPTIMQYNLPFCKERYARIATAMDIEWKNFENGAQKSVEAVKKLAKDLILPRFSSFGINPEDFSKLAVKAYENGSNPSNPRPMSTDDYEKILNELQNS
jgi:alcohol dehydrogenase